MPKQNCLIAVDFQNDFCAPPRPSLLTDPANPDPCLVDIARGGSLYVPGADKDAERLATFIRTNTLNIHHIYASADTHQEWSIFHPTWWKNRNGEHPDPFTPITVDDVRAKKWVTTIPDHQEKSEKYVEALAKDGKFVLVVWPPHCRVLSWGHAIYPPLLRAFEYWMHTFRGNVHYEVKGTNPFTEHYGIFGAEVPLSWDQGTQLHMKLIQRLEVHDKIFIAGEASSHCLAETVRQLMVNISPEARKRIYLLEDCMSPVPTFEAQADTFIAEAKAMGANFIDHTYVI